jgi:pimeloyl-ACP methyl ester carboxylesterase
MLSNKNGVSALVHAGIIFSSTTGCARFAPDFVREYENVAASYLEANPRSEGNFVREGHRIHFVTAGDPTRPKVIFVHGSPGSWSAFVHFLIDPAYLEAYRIAIDRPGYGESDNGKTEPSLAAQARVIAGSLDLGDPKAPAILVGHSYGGAVVARMAMARDSRIRSVIIVAGSVDPDLERTKWFQYPAGWKIFRWAIPTNLRVCNEEILSLKDGLTEALPLWKDIEASVSVIQGELDELVQPENVSFLDKILVRPLTKRVLIPEMNHFIPWRAPEKIREVVLEEWNRLGLGVSKGSL